MQMTLSVDAQWLTDKMPVEKQYLCIDPKSFYASVRQLALAPVDPIFDVLGIDTETLIDHT